MPTVAARRRQECRRLGARCDAFSAGCGLRAGDLRALVRVPPACSYSSLSLPYFPPTAASDSLCLIEVCRLQMADAVPTRPGDPMFLAFARSDLAVAGKAASLARPGALMKARAAFAATLAALALNVLSDARDQGCSARDGSGRHLPPSYCNLSLWKRDETAHFAKSGPFRTVGSCLPTPCQPYSRHAS